MAGFYNFYVNKSVENYLFIVFKIYETAYNNYTLYINNNID